VCRARHGDGKSVDVSVDFEERRRALRAAPYTARRSGRSLNFSAIAGGLRLYVYLPAVEWRLQ
jgi:hypothetical protein